MKKKIEMDNGLRDRICWRKIVDKEQECPLTGKPCETYPHCTFTVLPWVNMKPKLYPEYPKPYSKIKVTRAEEHAYQIVMTYVMSRSSY